MNVFHCGRFRFELDHPLVMGILNVTPDSFSDGGSFHQTNAGLKQVAQMIDEGVDIIDIGGESSRPGAAPVSTEAELARIIPIIKVLKDCGKAISIDTYKPEVMQIVLDLGVDMINDIRGFNSVAAGKIVAKYNCGLCIMHMKNDPQTMQQAPHYQNVLLEVGDFLQQRAQNLQQLGVHSKQIVIDPGFGFGKTLQHNLRLLEGICELSKMTQLPVLAGLSRKSMLGQITGKTVENRLAASIAAALRAVQYGAKILRVHDVAATVDALKIWQAKAE